jgi:branched-chain amino acid transport system substrate-binding protein
MRLLRYLGCVAMLASLWTNPVRAQTSVYIPDVVELSGPGAVSETNWRDGVALAIDEINNSGGILGRRIEAEHLDTQSNPGISRAGPEGSRP